MEWWVEDPCVTGDRNQLGSLFRGKFCSLQCWPEEAASRISSEAELSETENVEVSLRVAVRSAGAAGQNEWAQEHGEESCGAGGPGTFEA